MGARRKQNQRKLADAALDRRRLELERKKVDEVREAVGGYFSHDVLSAAEQAPSLTNQVRNMLASEHTLTLLTTDITHAFPGRRWKRSLRSWQLLKPRQALKHPRVKTRSRSLRQWWNQASQNSSSQGTSPQRLICVSFKLCAVEFPETKCLRSSAFSQNSLAS